MQTSITYPADAGADIFLLTVRGTPRASGSDDARDLHNATAGAPQSVAGARALGDLSHNVFVPAEDDLLRLMFIDTWNSPSGVGQFFGNPQVAEGADKLFSDRTATLWAPAAGFGSYSLPAPTGGSVSGVGYLRAPVTSIEAAREAFSAYASAGIYAARLAGQVAHQLWLPVAMPGAEPVNEVLGIDYWLDVKAMIEHYTSSDFSVFATAFAGAPETDTWMSAGSDWVEW
jgi:hypothetical protein